jgi:hypothetical protein
MHSIIKNEIPAINNEGIIKKQLSYSMLTILYCPIKYYLHYNKNIKIYSYNLVLGTMIHEIYEHQLNIIINDKNSPVNFEFVNNTYLNDLFDNTIKQYQHDEFFFPLILQYRDIIINDISQYLNVGLINTINNLLHNGYQLFIEKEIIIPNHINFLNEQFNLYTRYDFLLENDSSIKIFDIKSKNFNTSYITQLMLYLYNYIIANESINNKKLFGYNYLAYYDLIKPTVILEQKEIINYIQLLFNKLNQLYNELNISSLDTIEEWIINILPHNTIYQQLIDHHFSTCQFCPYISICFLKNPKNNTIFNLIKNNISVNDIKNELYQKNINNEDLII